LFYQVPKERLEGAAQVHMCCNLKYGSSKSPSISFQIEISLSSRLD
jgi:hypothetical protein